MKLIAILTSSSLALLTQLVACSNILGVFPRPTRSHFVVFDALMLALAERGHNVTVYSPFPKAHHQTAPNYTQVSLEGCFRRDRSKDSFAERISSGGRRTTPPVIWPTEESVLTCEPLLALRNSTASFDLMITETLNAGNDFFALFAHTFRVPLVLMHSHNAFPWMSEAAGLPHNPSYVSPPEVAFPARMNFFERLENTFLYLYALYTYKFHSAPKYDRIATKFFGPDAPRIEDAVRNASALFLNSHHSIHRSRPIVPNVVEIGGMNIGIAKALPKNIETFINESIHGVVYFSMGSILRSETFPEQKRNAFVNAFAKLPQRVLWKWDGDVLPNKTENIMISKWMPQRDILAHPNVKLFITHGGLLGTSEAVYEGVPVLGIPIWADQETNVEAIKANGAGEILSYDAISEESVYKKVSKLLEDPKYKRKAAELSLRFRDRPMSPKDTAVFWTEYVIRHKGAAHLKTSAINMPWYQYLLVDVIIFLLFVVLCFLLISYYVIKLTSRLVTHHLLGSDKLSLKLE